MEIKWMPLGAWDEVCFGMHMYSADPMLSMPCNLSTVQHYPSSVYSPRLSLTARSLSILCPIRGYCGSCRVIWRRLQTGHSSVSLSSRSALTSFQYAYASLC